MAELQSALFARITGLPVGDAGRAASLVAGDALAGAEARLQVYATMYRLRVAEALESQFPRIAAWLGAASFGQVAVAYVADVPSRHPSLRELGRGFSDWLASNRSAQPELAALARLEWARVDVFDLADEAVLTVDALRARPPEEFATLPLSLIVAHRFVDASPAVLATWDRLREAPAEQPDSRPDPDLTAGALVWRQDISVFHRGLGEDERAALEEVARGTTFGALCERLASGRSDDEAAAQAFAWLSTWTLDGLLAAGG